MRNYTFAGVFFISGGVHVLSGLLSLLSPGRPATPLELIASGLIMLGLSGAWALGSAWYRRCTERRRERACV
jgi:hypothetical protein